ncbi:hypothetical protein QBC37DRAFT_166222 [Rhypophila decipiens]|uniref:Secreted protein n=1 Tax=Rhypophila decipiens TaxID=261697 RepID=A0AAN7BD69_9PEZI|nr:hypothetical protein QBC37DRAFT_166222 [Rhypophila decipiens]
MIPPHLRLKYFVFIFWFLFISHSLWSSNWRFCRGCQLRGYRILGGLVGIRKRTSSWRWISLGGIASIGDFVSRHSNPLLDGFLSSFCWEGAVWIIWHGIEGLYQNIHRPSRCTSWQQSRARSSGRGISKTFNLRAIHHVRFLTFQGYYTRGRLLGIHRESETAYLHAQSGL